jgi:hypothetical protein
MLDSPMWRKLLNLRRLFIAFVVAGAGWSACRQVSAPSIRPGVPSPGVITTDSTVYTAKSSGGSSYRVQVIVRYANSTSGRLYLASCLPNDKTPMYVVGLLDQVDKEGAAWNPIWACTGHDQRIFVEAGATRVDTFQLFAPNATDGITGRAFGVFAGRFRLGLRPQTCPTDGGCGAVADSLRLSNDFYIQLPR